MAREAARDGAGSIGSQVGSPSGATRRQMMNANSLSKHRPQEVHSLQVSSNLTNLRELEKRERASKAGYGSLGKKMPELPAPISSTRFAHPADGVIVRGGVVNLPAYFNNNEPGLNK